MRPRQVLIAVWLIAIASVIYKLVIPLWLISLSPSGQGQSPVDARHLRIMAMVFQGGIAVPVLLIPAFICFGILRRWNWVRIFFAVLVALTICWTGYWAFFGALLDGRPLRFLWAWFQGGSGGYYLTLVIAIILLFSRASNTWFRGAEPESDT